MPDLPHVPHAEAHFEASDTVRDVVIGMSDGLTVPFALAAGLTGTAAATSKLVVIAGLAEIAAGSIAMGLGGYLAARTDREHYQNEVSREYRETVELPDKEREEVADVFRGYGMTEQQLTPVVDAIVSDQKRWVDFMMRFELGYEEPDPKRARNSAVTIAASYIVGGLVPLSSYMLVSDLTTALYSSVAVTLVALFLFGFFKGRITGISPLRGGLQTVIIGGLASAAASAWRDGSAKLGLMLRRRDCLYLFALPALRAQTPARTVLEELAASQKTPGLAAAIRAKDAEVFSQAAGEATPATRFRIGSLSKLLTAATAARLYDRGLLDLDAPVQKYAPSFPDKGVPITARQLLGHLAGIRHYGPNEYINTTHYATVADGLKIFQDSPLVQPPGVKYLYSSYGYNLLGLVIEGAAKLEFTACVQRELLDPLGMKDTGTGESLPHVSRFYAASNGNVGEAPRVDNSDRLPSGGFLSTARDLARFGAAHLHGDFLKPATRTLMFTSQKAADGKETGVGFGWRIAQIAGERVYHHGGDAMGGRAFLLLRPEHNLSVGIACNLSFARVAETNAMALSQQFAV